MRKRSIYLVLTLIVMLLGLLSRRVEGLPLWIEAYSGDTLWALMVYLGLAFLMKKQGTLMIGVYGLIFAYGIEISQLYHAPWIDSIRATALGGLVLGYGFLWQDLICYAVGIVLGMGIDYSVKKLLG